MNRAERRALARKQGHRGRVTDERPRATVQHIDPDGNVVKTETVYAEDAERLVDDAETAKANREAYEREATKARAQSLGLWLPNT